MLAGLGAVVLAACGGSAPSTLAPEGLSARRVAGLWWLLFGVSVVVVVFVFGLLAWALIRRRRRGVEAGTGSRSRFVVTFGVLIPALVLTGVYVIGLRDMRALEEPDEPARFTIDVVGHQWWWEVRYAGTDAVTANEIHIPAGEPVRLRLSTGDVNHSFWVPRLAPKTDLVAGRINSMWLQADRPGRYRGQCAEYCGTQHGRMAFTVVAEPVEQFESWLAGRASPASTPSSARARAGRQVFLSSSCASCHTVRGTPADGALGPDLTHVASRELLGAGTIPNTPRYLRDWISNSQEFKPGNKMPRQPLSPEELDAVVAYLRSLE